MTKRLVWLFLIFLGGCESCDTANESFTPESLEGATLHATATEVTGSFGASMAPGYTFDTVLGKNNTFTTTSTSKTADSQGSYTYTREDGQTATLKLIDSSALHKDESILVKLTFTSPKVGTYSVQVLKGQSGEQKGTFELR